MRPRNREGDELAASPNCLTISHYYGIHNRLLPYTLSKSAAMRAPRGRPAGDALGIGGNKHARRVHERFARDIAANGAAAMPQADGVPVGGGPDLTRRIAFYDVSLAGTCDVISSSTSDTVRGALVGVPGSGNPLPGTAPNMAGAKGAWLQSTLSPGAAAYKGSADPRAQETTT
jgi:hypothetical protein